MIKVFWWCTPVRVDGIILFLFTAEVLGSTFLTFPIDDFEIIALVGSLDIVFCDEDIPALDKLVAVKIKEH